MGLALNRDELLKVDNVVLLGLLLVAALFGYLSFAPAVLTDNHKHGAKVAVVSSVESTVRRKSADSIAWNDASSDDAVYAGDQIFTDRQSNAHVKFGDGSEITVAENSLVKIEKKGGKTTLDMTKGFVSGKLGKNDSAFTIKLGGTRVKLEKGAEIQVNVDPNNKNATKVSLISGNASIQAGNQALTLTKDQVLSVDQAGTAKVQEIDLKPILPAPGARLDADENPSIFFKWESRQSDAAYTLVVARDSNFRSVVISRETADKAVTLPSPASGSYFWRVRSRNAAGKIDESVQSQFTVARMDTPQLLAPTDGRQFQITAGEKTTSMSFLWRGSPDAKTYDLEVGHERDFQHTVLTKTVSEPGLETKELGEGPWFWRVRAHGAAGQASPWSAGSAFKIVRTLPPPPPTLLAPENGARLPPGEPVEFRWSDAAEADGYQLEVSRTKDFSGPAEVITKVPASPYAWTPAAPGVRYWRLRAIDRLGRETAYAQPRSLIVEAAAPLLVVPEDGAQITLVKKDMSLDFAWTKTAGTGGYTIEVAADPGFSKIAVRQVVGPAAFRWDHLKAGRYYWRVRPGHSGAEGGTTSQARSFDLKDLDLLPPPTLLDRYYFRLPPPLPATAWLGKLLNEVVASGTAYAQEAEAEATAAQEDGKVIVTWKPVESAAGYYVELAADRSFAKILVERRTKVTSFQWPEAKPGRYWLRARSVDGNDRMGRMSKLAEVIVNYKAPQLYEPRDEAVLKPAAATPAVAFTWQNVPGATKFTLELARSADFAKPVIVKSVTGGSQTLQGLASGAYWWRVKAQYQPGLPVEATKPWRFTLETKRLAAPLLLTPKSDATVRREEDDEPVKITWQPVPGAASYTLEMADDEAFTSGVTKHQVTAAAVTLPLEDGDWFARVSGLTAGDAPGLASEVRAFHVATRLPAPELVKPAADADFTLTGKGPAPVDVTWNAVDQAASYQVEAAATADFAQVTKAAAGPGLSQQLKLGAGAYFLRARAVDGAKVPGKWSDARSVTVAAPKLTPPDPVYPGDGEQLGNIKTVRLAWEKDDLWTGYRVVVSRDPKFKKILSDRTIKGDAEAAQVKLPTSGPYYWYVEGKNRERRLAMRSDIQTFKVADPPAAGDSSARIMAGYAPSLVTNTMVSQTVNNSLAVAVFNSFYVSGQFWLSQPFGIEALYQRKSVELYKNQGTLAGSSDQDPLPFVPQSLDLRAIGRFRLWASPTAPSVYARAGYLYKTFFTYFAKSRTALDLLGTSVHHAAAGVGGKIPLTLDKYLEASVDLAEPFKSSPAQVKSGSYFAAEGGFYLLYDRHLLAGFGFRYANATYEFVDSDHGVDGTLQEKSYSLLASLGWNL